MMEPTTVAGTLLGALLNKVRLLSGARACCVGE